MFINKCLFVIVASICLSLFSLASYAGHMVVAPACLFKQAGLSEKAHAANQALMLAKVNDADIQTLIAAKHQMKTVCGGFIDVTNQFSSQNYQAFLANFNASPKNKFAANKSYGIRYEAETNAVLNQINPTLMWSNLSTFSSNQDRYADSKYGVKAAGWIKDNVEAMVKSSGRDDVAIYYIKTPSYKQPSLVVKLGNSAEPGIVIGAHMDTLKSWGSNNAPGADDDGSGSMVVIVR